jgi:Flp pilus assembly secretin CpaC
MPEFSVSLAPETAPPAVMVVANFGIVAGRLASRQEIEKLWRSVRRIVPQATISVEDHNHFGKRTSTCVHQVSVAVGEDVVRRAKQDPELLRTQLEVTLDRWLAACAERVQGEMTFAERRARHAVIDKT